MYIAKSIMHSINRRIMTMTYDQVVAIQDIINNAMVDDKLVITEYDITAMADALDVNTDCIFDMLADIGCVSYKKNQVKFDKFIAWYLSERDDVMSMGLLVKRALMMEGKFRVNIDQLFNECHYIPQYICEDANGNEEYQPNEVELIK